MKGRINNAKSYLSQRDARGLKYVKINLRYICRFSRGSSCKTLPFVAYFISFLKTIVPDYDNHCSIHEVPIVICVIEWDF